MSDIDPVAKAKVLTETFEFQPWIVTATRSHILNSEGPEREKFEGQLQLPQCPEMVFADNVLTVKHKDKFGIQFRALDALKLVDAHNDPLKVAMSDSWREARSDCEHIKDTIKPFDWTYSTDYKGTLFGAETGQLKVVPTTERIDLDKLKQREKIHFYQDLLLFEDELADFGSSVLSAKIRVMPSSFFILLRFYMRVDSVIVRVNDTRYYHEAGKNYILREFSSRDDNVADIKVAPHVLTDPNEVSNHLTLRVEQIEKLEFPTKSCTDTSADTSR